MEKSGAIDFKAGQKVKHKLTGEYFLILTKDGFGPTLRPMQRLRKHDLSEVWLDEYELILEK